METIGEILAQVDMAKSRQAKKEILVNNKKIPVLQHLLRGMFDPKVEWVITDQPDFMPNEVPDGINENTLFNEIPKCSIFVKGHPAGQGVKPERLKIILTQILESLHPREAMLYMQMLKKRSKIKGLTSKLVLEVWPNMYQEKGAEQ